MALGYTAALQNAMMNEITTAADAGTGASKIRIYDGTRPADADTAVSGQTLLAELTCTDPFAAAASGGVLTVSAITDDSAANATGEATWFRLVDSDNNAVLDGDVGTVGADLNLSTTAIVINDVVEITSATITNGNP